MLLINSINHNIFITLDRIVPNWSIRVVDKNHQILASRHIRNSNFEKLSLNNITGNVTVIVEYNELTYSRNIYVH